MMDDDKDTSDREPRYSQYDMDAATKPLHAEIERLRAALPPTALTTWSCKIGEVAETLLSDGADEPMRLAVREAYIELTGDDPSFIFSGWGARLTSDERDALLPVTRAATEPR